MKVVIPGDPVGKGRPRATVIAGHARLYTPSTTAEWEKAAALLMRQEWAWRSPLECAVRVEVLAIAARPKRLLRKKDPDGRLWRCAKPDADNVAKAALDALVQAGVLRDDVQVVELVARSLYASRAEGPSVELTMVELTGDGP